MNKIEFTIADTDDVKYVIFDEDDYEDESNFFAAVCYSLQIRTIVDGKELLLLDDNFFYGLEVERFLEESKIVKKGTKKLGICCCGCEGCNDYIVDVSLNDDIVVWYNYQTGEEYQFEVKQYEDAIDKVRICYEQIVREAQEKKKQDLESYIPCCLKGTINKKHYVFDHVVIDIELLKITLVYSDEAGNACQEYELLWDDVYDELELFIQKELQENRCLKSRALEIACNYNYLDSNTKLDKQNAFLLALTCSSQEAKIVAILCSFSEKFPNPDEEWLLKKGFEKNIIEAYECLQKNRYYIGLKITKNEYNALIKRIEENPIAYEVVTTRYQMKSKPNQCKMIKKALKIALKANGGEIDRQMLHLMQVALYCDTEDAQIVALLQDVAQNPKITQEKFRKEGFGDNILTALDCLIKKEGEAKEVYFERILSNEIVLVVKIHTLRNELDILRGIASMNEIFILRGLDRIQWNADTYNDLVYLEKRIAKDENV